MRISYGPPGATGVKSLQYVSGVGDDADFVTTNLHLVAKPVGVLALGTWAYALATRNAKLRKRALAVSIGAFVVQLLTSSR